MRRHHLGCLDVQRPGHRVRRQAAAAAACAVLLIGGCLQSNSQALTAGCSVFTAYVTSRKQIVTL